MYNLNNKKHICLICVCLCLFLFAGFKPVYAQPGCALDMDINTLNYDSDVTTQDIETSITGAASQTIYVGVVGQNVNNLDTYQVEVLFDPARLTFTGGFEENPFGGITNLLKKNGGTTVGFQAVEHNSGIVTIANSLTGDDTSEAPEGTGILALLQFTVLDDNLDNTLTLANVQFVDSAGHDESVTNFMHATINKDLSVAITSTVSGTTNQSPVSVSVTFSEDVTGFEESDIILSNSMLINFQGSGAEYTFDLIPEDSDVTADIPANVAQNAEGIENTAGEQLSFTWAGKHLHLTDVTGFSSKNNNSEYSGVAVADMILKYLDSDNRYFSDESETDSRQETLSTLYAGDDSVISISEQLQMLDEQSPDVYNFASSIDSNSIWSESDAENQERVNQFIMHWIDYEVSDAPEDRKNVPAAVATSSNPATSSPSDFEHWMSIVGYSADQDPYLTSWDIPNVQLFGFYVNDPSADGLGFHKYITAYEWNTNYFMPLADGLEGAGKYGAVLEPPEDDVKNQIYQQAHSNPNPELKNILSNPELTYRYKNFWTKDQNTEQDEEEIKESLMKSPDFRKMLKSDLYKDAFNPGDIKRIIKVERQGNDYALVLFEKYVQDNLATSAAAVVSLDEGRFEIGIANPQADTYFTEMTRREGFWNVYSQTREIPFSIWPSLEQNDPLNYGQKIVTFKSANMGRQTRIYQAEKDGSVSLKGKSPAIKLLSANLEYAWRNWRYSVAEKNWYYTDESKDPGWYYHYKFKVTDDEEVADIELPSSVGSVKTESIENGYVCEFYSDNKNWKNIQATDYDYKGSIYSGGVSWRYFK